MLPLVHAPFPNPADQRGQTLIVEIVDGHELGDLHSPYLPHKGKIGKPSQANDGNIFLEQITLMGNQLRQLRLQKGWTHQEMADHMGFSRDHVIKLERSSRQLTTATITAAAKAFNVTESEIVADLGMIRIIGLVGAETDGTISFSSDGELGLAPKPPGSTDHTVAVEVRGSSMRGVADDGWLVYYDDVRAPVTEDMIGELCVVWLRDGRVLIKKPYQARTPGRFDLESSNADTIHDIEVSSAAFVTFLAPRRTARAMVKRAS